MASEQQPSSLPEPLCPGCGAAGPLVLPCGHSLCQACLSLCQRELGPGEAGCTECYGRELLDSVMKGLLDRLFQDQPRRPGGAGGDGDRAGELCPRHGERLTHFCVEDEEPVCEACRSSEHEEHECCSTEEAVHDCKRELRSALRPLQEKLEALNTAKQTCEESAEHIKRQAQHALRLLKEDFEKLHQFLRDEEAAAMTLLKEEEEQKSERMKERMDRLAGEIASLTEVMNDTEEAMGSDDVAFLKNYKKTSERAQFKVQEPEELAEALIDVAKHVGCLKYRVWDKMQTIIQYTPVTLDPNTADVCLSLSDDMTSVRYTEDDQALPDNRERFSSCECVLGSEGFCSGRHAWDVEVGDCSEWALGVAKETVPRKEWFPPSPERGLWSICLHGGEYRARTTTGAILALKRKPQRVRVQLDWDRGRVTFSDAGDNTLLYKFQHKFAEKMFPYFSNTCKRHALRISPGKVSVTAE